MTGTDSARRMQGGVVVLSCQGVGKSFPVIDEGTAWRILLGRPDHRQGTQAVENVSLMVPKGKVVGVLGRNGAGKSTLLRILAGVYCHTSGSVYVNGSMSGLFELGGLGRPDLTGAEYATRILALQGVGRSTLPGLLDDIRAFSELGPYFDAPIHTLSTGMAARLYFSAATALTYNVYLMDEALAVGDEHFRHKCWSRLRDRLKEGASGVLVTHDWPAVMRLCETSCIMDGGRIIATGPTESVVAAYLGHTSAVSPTCASFAEDDQAEYRARTGEDTEFRFVVELKKDVPLYAAYSIELVRPGAAWEVLLLKQDMFIGSTGGRYDVRLNVPALPLAPGRYYLNLFLSSGPSEKERQGRVAYDVRSWTYGNPIPLTVEGNESAGVVALRLEWTKIVLPEGSLAAAKPAASTGKG